MTAVLAPQRQAARIRLAALALVPAPIVALAVMLAVTGAPVLWPMLIGAGGWLAALVLRQPIALIASRRLSQEATARLVGWFSGPAEEIVRVILVLLTVHAVQEAAWFGYGWATIEVVIIAVNVLAIAGLMTKDDPKSVEARELLESQGMLKTQNPLWSLLERLSATALHLGFTLLLFAQPWLVLATIPAHSLTNMLAVKFGKTHLVLTEFGLALAGALVLALGILAVA